MLYEPPREKTSLRDNRPGLTQTGLYSHIFRIKVEEGLYYLCSENKCADQLRGNRAADLWLFFAYMPKASFLIARLI